MKRLNFALATISLNTFAATYDQHVDALKNQRPQDADKIDHIAILTKDLVIHYEKAITLGTTPDYRNSTLKSHFNDFMEASDTVCEDIHLTTCIYDLICENKVRHNLNVKNMAL